MIRDRLDPDALHPARLAGTHAWAAWGLTRRADPDHLQLAIPARHEDGYLQNLLREIANRLRQPVWPTSTAPPLLAANPDRFSNRRPTPPKLPTVAWINEPTPEALIHSA
jgi:hypothetical protein